MRSDETAGFVLVDPDIFDNALPLFLEVVEIPNAAVAIDHVMVRQCLSCAHVFVCDLSV